MKPSVRNNSTEGTLASVRRPSVCATGLPSLPRALGLGATLRCQAPPAPPSAALRSSHTPARPQWLYGAMGWLLRPPARAYLVLRAFASLSVARSGGFLGHKSSYPRKRASRLFRGFLDSRLCGNDLFGNPLASGSGDVGVGAAFLAQDEKTRIGSEAEFDLGAVDVRYHDLDRSSGKQFPDRHLRIKVFHHIGDKK